MIQTEPIVVYLGTRNSSLESHFGFCFGARVSTDRDILTVFLPEYDHEEIMADLADNGQMAVAINYTPGHETYQLKGERIAIRPITEADYALQKIWYDKIVPYLPPHLAPPAVTPRLRPSLAIEMRIRDVYEQTPGPGTGGLLASSKEGA